MVVRDLTGGSRQSEGKRELKLEPRGLWRSPLQSGVLRQPPEGGAAERGRQRPE